MTLNTTTKINGKPISALTSQEITDTVRALLAHRKTVNAAERAKREDAKATRLTAQREKKAAQASKLEAKLAKLKQDLGEIAA